MSAVVRPFQVEFLEGTVLLDSGSPVLLHDKFGGFVVVV